METDMQIVKHSFSRVVKHQLLAQGSNGADNKAMLTGKKFGMYLQELAQKREVTSTQLADLAGVTLQAVNGWFNTGRISKESLSAIAPALGLTSDQLLAGAVPGNDRGPGPVPARAVSRVPVISWVAAGKWQEAFDPYAPGDAARWEELTEQVGPNVFALEVRGDSMEDPGARVSFPEGCLIIVDSERKMKPGDFVVVRNNTWDEATFKQYVVDGGEKLLKPLNPRYRAQQIPHGTVVVGVVILKIEKQRF